MTSFFSAAANAFGFLELLLASFLDLCKPYLPDLNGLMQWALTASALILTVLLLRLVLGRRISCRVRYALWAVVLVRLLLPFQLPLSLPYSAAAMAPEAPAAWEEVSVPVFPGPSYDFEDAHPYYSQLEPGYLGPSVWSYGYVHRSEDGQTMTSYVDLYSPSRIAQSVWWVGTVVFTSVFLISNLRFHRRLRKRRRSLPLEVASHPVYVVEGLPSPCLFGLFRPAIYLTPEAAENETTRRHVLAHELTHYAHRDHIWSALRCVCLALHWYNPLVWLAVILSKRDGELACDEGAVKRLGEEERLNYGRTLLNMVARRTTGPIDLLSCSTTMTEGKKTIQQRIKLLVKHPQTAKTALFAAVAVVALAVVFTFSNGQGLVAPPINSYEAFLTYLNADDNPRFSEGDIPASALAQWREVLSQGTALDSWTTPKEFSDISDSASFDLMGDMARCDLLETEDGCYLTVYDLYDQLNAQGWRRLGYALTRDHYRLALLPSGTVARLRALTISSNDPADCYAQFSAQAEAAQQISVYAPPYFSVFYPDPITDLDLLKEAKALLARSDEILSTPEELEAEIDFSHAAYSSYRLYLGQGPVYYLFSAGSKCYVLLPKDPASTLPEQWSYVAVLSSNPGSTLLSLAQRQYNRNLEPAVPLTARELAWFNEGNFFNNDGAGVPEHRIRNQFLTCFYQQPEDIDLYQLFYNGSFLPQAQEVTQEEWNDLPNASEIGVWPTKTTTAEMNQVLQTYLGLTLEQTNQVGLNYWLYLPKYDAYYTFHGDTNYPWDFQFTSGYRQGDMVTLFYQHTQLYSMGSCAVVLREVGDSYQFYANLPIPPVWLDMSTLEFMEHLETRYITQVTTDNTPTRQLSPDLETLVWLIHQSADQQTSREYSYEQHGVYALSIHVVGPDGQSHVGTADNQLHLSVGNEENVVCLYYQDSADQDSRYVFAESPELYQMVRELVQEEHELYAPDYVHALSTLLLENPDARALNLADEAGSEYEDWLRGPLYSYTVQYGIPFRHDEACWYALARSPGGSAYQVLIPDSMVQQVLAHCRSHDEYAAQEAVLRAPAYTRLMEALLPMALADPEMMSRDMDSNDGAAQTKWTGWLDSRLGGLELSVKHDLYRHCYLVPQDGGFLTVPDTMLSRDAVLMYPYEPTNIFIDTDSAGSQAIAQQFAQELARRYLALDSRHPMAVTFAQPYQIQINDEISGAFLAEVHMAVEPVEINSLWWAAGAGPEQIKDGPLSGYYDLSGQYRLVREQDGHWHCTAYETYGGAWGLRADGLSQGY